MKPRVYISNLPTTWPIERQERALAPVLAGATVFRDILAPKDRQGRRREFMVALDKMLRSTTKRQPDEVTIVAVLGVLDWTEAGLLNRIALVHERGGVLRVMEPALVIGPNATTRELHAAIEAFHASKERKPKSQERGRAGADASKKVRWDAAEAKLQAIKERWQVGNQREHRSADLLAEAGVTRNTAIDHIGKRMGPR